MSGKRRHYTLGTVSVKKERQRKRADEELWRVAERVCDKLMGKGTYERINGFSPKRGEYSRAAAWLARERKERDDRAK